MRISARTMTATVETATTIDDDRDARPGVMFADMELIGVPHRVVIGERGLDRGEVEYRARTDSENRMLPLEGFVDFIREQILADTRTSPG